MTAAEDTRRLLEADSIDVQRWPGRAMRRARGRRSRGKPASFRRTSLVVEAVAERGAPVERLGLAGFQVVQGDRILRQGVIVPDDVDPARLRELEEFAAAHPLETPIGRRPTEILTLRQFCDPKSGLFWRVGYCGAGYIVTSDLGRLLGLIAERFTEAHGPYAGGFTCYLPGCYETEHGDDGRERLRSVPHRPAIRIKSLGEGGFLAAFMKPRPRGGGKRVGGRPFAGRLLSLTSAAYGLDGVDSGELADHLAVWDVPAAELPAAAPISADGAEQVLAATEAVHRWR